MNDKMDSFVSIIPNESAVHLPRFQTKAGEQCINLNRIMYLRAQLNYTVFYLQDGEQVITSLSLSTYARLLEPYNFIRIHKSHLINKQYLTVCRMKKDNKLILPDNQEVTIARRRRSKLKKVKL